jgi:hypothetical protein
MDRRRREPKTAAIHKHEKGRKLVEDDKESAEGGELTMPGLAS